MGKETFLDRGRFTFFIVVFRGAAASFCFVGGSVMAVMALTGGLGGGKTIEGVQIVVNMLKARRHVYTNIDGLNETKYLVGLFAMVAADTSMDDYEIKRYLHFLNPLEVPVFPSVIEHDMSVIVIDEAHEHLDSREWDRDGRKNVNTWIKMSRHNGHDLIFLTQDVEELDKRIRSLVDWTYYFQKMDYVGDLLTGVCEVKLYKKADLKKKPFKTFSRRYNKKLFECYKSYNAPNIVECGVKKNPNIFMHWSVFAAGLAICVFIYFAVFRSTVFSGDIFGAKKLMSRGRSVQAAVNKPVAVKRYTSDSQIKGAVVPAVVVPVVAVAEKPVKSVVVVSDQAEPLPCRIVSTVVVDGVVSQVRECSGYSEGVSNGVVTWRIKTSGARTGVTGVNYAKKGGA